MAGCGDTLSLADLQTAKKHQTFEAEVITGKAGGVAGGADIDEATNQVTGQTQRTLPAILRDAGFQPASFDFTSGGTLGVNDRDKVVYDPVSKTWYSWGGALPHVIAAGTNPVGLADWTPQTDPNLRNDLAASSGAGLSGYNYSNNYGAGTVGAKLTNLTDTTRPVVNISKYATLKAAIAALPASGGTVYVPIGRFEAGDWDYNTNYMSKANVAIIGEKMPTWASDIASLNNGSVITGRFNVWADNFSVESVGFDMGKTYSDIKFPGATFTTASHPLGGTWDAFAFASPNDGSGPRRNARIRNVVGLLHDSAAVGHAVLMEGITEGSAENTVAIYGIHGNVIKALRFHATNLISYGQSTNGLIIKSDTYAACGDVTIDGTFHAKQPIGTTPWSAAAKTENAVCINSGTLAFSGAILINNTIAYDAANHLRPQGLIAISDVIVTGQKSERCDWPVIIDGSSNCLRMIINGAVWSNCTQGAFVSQAQSWPGQSQLTLKSVKATNITNAIFYVMPTGLIVIDEFEAYNIKYVYSWQAGGKIYVGNERVNQLTGGNKFDPAGIAPILGGGWVNYDAANSQYDFKLSGYKARLAGLMKTTGTDANVVQLPGSLRPSLPVRVGCIQNDAAGVHGGFVTIGSSVQIGNGEIPSGLVYLSLDSIEWSY